MKREIKFKEGDVVTDGSIVDDVGSPFKGELVRVDGNLCYGKTNCSCGECSGAIFVQGESTFIIGTIADHPELLEA
jgi:hypothetical protein